MNVMTCFYFYFVIFYGRDCTAPVLDPWYVEYVLHFKHNEDSCSWWVYFIFSPLFCVIPLRFSDVLAS